jgi:L-seryl-tRNA(Ser) seleniumtransferase
VRDGWDLVAFSGDKLLGGAQAGVILGKLPLLQRLARNPWMRALRLDKLRLAALQGSLLDHLLEPAGLPVVAMLETPLSELKRRANRLANRLKPLLKGRAEVSTAPSQASLGGGTTPEQLLESWACRITPRSESLEEWARQLRLQNPALLGRLHQGSLWLDMRTLFPAQTSALVRAFQQL